MEKVFHAPNISFWNMSVKSQALHILIYQKCANVNVCVFVGAGTNCPKRKKSELENTLKFSWKMSSTKVWNANNLQVAGCAAAAESWKLSALKDQTKTFSQDMQDTWHITSFDMLSRHTLFYSSHFWARIRMHLKRHLSGRTKDSGQSSSRKSQLIDYDWWYVCGCMRKKRFGGQLKFK